jgi:nicotinate dehydrogenase subunit A
MTENVETTVNGRAVTLRAEDPEMPLLYALRNELGLTGLHFGCGLAQCGACTVHVDGEAVRSCQFPATQARGRRVVTLEGLGTPEQPHPVQKAFIETQAVQCGYCLPGMIMTSVALLARTPKPTEAQIREELAGVICRCGTHPRVIAAVLRAAQG